MEPRNDWEDWEFAEEDPYLHDLDDPDEKPRTFSAEELASLFRED